MSVFCTAGAISASLDAVSDASGHYCLVISAEPLANGSSVYPLRFVPQLPAASPCRLLCVDLAG